MCLSCDKVGPDIRGPVLMSGRLNNIIILLITDYFTRSEYIDIPYMFKTNVETMAEMLMNENNSRYLMYLLVLIVPTNSSKSYN